MLLLPEVMDDSLWQYIFSSAAGSRESSSPRVSGCPFHDVAKKLL